jgi:hypothetical protein
MSQFDLTSDAGHALWIDETWRVAGRIQIDSEASLRQFQTNKRLVEDVVICFGPSD